MLSCYPPFNYFNNKMVFELIKWIELVQARQDTRRSEIRKKVIREAHFLKVNFSVKARVYMDGNFVKGQMLTNLKQKLTD